MNKYKVGISLGDINGIGPEIVLKALANRRIFKTITPIIYGSSKVLNYHKNLIKRLGDVSFVNTKDVENAAQNKINVINCGSDTAEITLGQPTKESGQFAIDCLHRMAQDAKAGLLDMVVTAPINKHAMKMASWKYPGHTEFFGNEFEVKDQLMFMVSDTLKVAMVTGHVPVADISKHLDKAMINYKIKLLERSLKVDFGVEKPKIAVLGLNPHAGDQGSIGKEDVDVITPTILEAKKQGLLVSGPYAADGFFASNQFSKADAILAMYHDQGLIPFKAMTFGKGVNFTAGLPMVRTSPDHGTGYDIAGKDMANHKSFLQAIYTALDITRNRAEYAEITANPLKRTKK